MPFELKTAPSLFQKAMIKIFRPLIKNALVYIDDILLFSQDESSHLRLLDQFYDLCQEYGIMLSEKKMMIGKRSIDFLGMHIEEGKYVPLPHIAEQLINFPDERLTVKQLQQFLGIINYFLEFIPHLAKHRSTLSALLKKKPPPWNDSHTSAVQVLKRIVPNLPLLSLPQPQYKKVLPTDASDYAWGAALFSETPDGHRHIVGYKSGSFKPSEQHYHSTYKEILAVKFAVQKFQFLLTGCEFTIEMDMSAFPEMLKFK